MLNDSRNLIDSINDEEEIVEPRLRLACMDFLVGIPAHLISSLDENENAAKQSQREELRRCAGQCV